jgi:predicted nucleotidyltransferase
MLDMSRAPHDLLHHIAQVVEAAVAAAEGLKPDHIMVVGAWCRDILHNALGHSFPTAATRDLDLALALSSWDAYRALAASFRQAGNTGIRFSIAGENVDLLPFGSVENPDGVVSPPSRDEPFSVWAFEEVFATSLPLPLTDTLSIRIPTVAGYAAAKLGAWLDRSQWHEAKDAADLALTMYWYAESTVVHDGLYDTPAGNKILLAEGLDLPLAAAHLLGTDVTVTIGPRRRAELLARWPGNTDLLVRELRLHGSPNWPSDARHRSTLIEALTRGLSD